MGLFRSRKQVEEKFWNWFTNNEEQIFHFENNQDQVFNSLDQALKTVNKYLTFEFGPVINGKREFVISADGIKEAFPAVEALYSKAPSFDNWEIVKFRQRRPPMNIQFGDLLIKHTDLLVALAKQGSLIDLTVFIKGMTKEKARIFQQAAFILLDQAIGEYEMETKVGIIQVMPYDPSINVDLVTLLELPEKFNALI